MCGFVCSNFSDILEHTFGMVPYFRMPLQMCMKHPLNTGNDVPVLVLDAVQYLSKGGIHLYVFNVRLAM